MTRLVVILLAAVLGAGCDSGQQDRGPSLAEFIAVREEVKILKEELGQLKEDQEQTDFDQIAKDFDRVAYLQAGDSGYSAIRYDLGVLTVQLSDVQPYANGSRVVLRIGNPLYTAVNGLKAKVEWGHTNENGSPDNESARAKAITLNEILRPGAWTNSSVVLEGIPPAQLGFVRLRDVTHTGISLSR